MTNRILTELKEKINELVLVPGTGGAFELSVGEELVYSKLKTGQFPDESWVIETLKRKAA